MKKIILFITIIQFGNLTAAQNSSDFSVSFNHIALSVKDIVESTEFYKNTLNLKEIENKTKREHRSWLSLGEDKELHLISNFEGKIITNKAVHLAVTTSNFDAFLKKIKSLNINYFDWLGTPNNKSLRADGIEQVYFQDPNGYWIEVNSVGIKK